MRFASLFAVPFLALAIPAVAADLPPGHPPVDPNTRHLSADHSGEVVEAVPAAGYVYVHVKGDGGDEWLAGPATDLKAGAKVRWNTGTVMHNFASKSLNRTFADIRFVEVLEAAN